MTKFLIFSLVICYSLACKAQYHDSLLIGKWQLDSIDSDELTSQDSIEFNDMKDHMSILFQANHRFVYLSFDEESSADTKEEGDWVLSEQGLKQCYDSNPNDCAYHSIVIVNRRLIFFYREEKYYFRKE